MKCEVPIWRNITSSLFLSTNRQDSNLDRQCVVVSSTKFLAISPTTCTFIALVTWLHDFHSLMVLSKLEFVQYDISFRISPTLWYLTITHSSLYFSTARLATFHTPIFETSWGCDWTLTKFTTLRGLDAFWSGCTRRSHEPPGPLNFVPLEVRHPWNDNRAFVVVN